MEKKFKAKKERKRIQKYKKEGRKENERNYLSGVERKK